MGGHPRRSGRGGEVRSHRVCLIGAGNIAELHIAALREIEAAEVVAVSDCDEPRARDFAARWGVPRAVGDIRVLLNDRGFDVAHVLVQPPVHRAVAEPLLRAGVNVLVEKPMAAATEECQALIEAARAGGAALAVNHNAVHHPAHQALKAMVAAGTIGGLRHMTMRFSMPLHQLKTRQLGHWMFDAPRNLLLEQAVHPLSQVEDLFGPAVEVAALPGPLLRIAKGLELHPTWLITCVCARGTAQLLFSLGETYSSWGASVLGRDGAIHVDYVANRVWREEAHRWLEAFSHYRTGISASLQMGRESRRNLGAYIASTLRLTPRSDPHFVSMRRSIEAFYRALDDEQASAALNATEGRRIVMLCEKIAAAARAPARQAAQTAMPTFAATGTEFRHQQVASFAGGAATSGVETQRATLGAVAPISGSSPNRWQSAPGAARDGATARSQPLPDVLVVGGTGFIGSKLVPMLVQKGMRVSVLSRNPRNLPAVFWSGAVSIHRGSITQRERVTQALRGTTFAVNLAHAGGATDWPAIERAIVGGAVELAKLCLEEGVRRLVHVSSISALYLGDRNAMMTGASLPDPRPEREPYSRAKAVAEAELMRLHARDGLRVCILRPGLVIGEGGSPFHDGAGFYNTDRHCLGWNHGDNPLPFVLVEDVAKAVVCALEAPDVDGRCYNIVGAVGLTAREYIAELARALDRPLRYHPQSLSKLFGIELAKWAVKRAVGRRDGWPSYADLRSRGILCRFDFSDAERDLDWHPVRERAAFVQHGIGVHAGS
jgi:predicted dehydrogenase/nucleoside-diphosphate-sugar epimerase